MLLGLLFLGQLMKIVSKKFIRNRILSQFFLLTVNKFQRKLNVYSISIYWHLQFSYLGMSVLENPTQRKPAVPHRDDVVSLLVWYGSTMVWFCLNAIDMCDMVRDEWYGYGTVW